MSFRGLSRSIPLACVVTFFSGFGLIVGCTPPATPVATTDVVSPGTKSGATDDAASATSNPPAASSDTAFTPQTTGTAGAPDATTTIDGQQLPAPAPEFGGKIEHNAGESTAWWPPRVVPPSEAPNVLLIMTDDVGYGAPSTFGGVIPTPALDRIAEHGLRYTNFHSTALCSPTRAALITGRNHHSMGFGVISEQSTGFPGYDSIMSEDKATIGQILLENGYSTSWFGKDHNTPTFEASQAGPFHHWPCGMGFEYFYGFVGGDTSQWEPNLFRNTTQIYPYVGQEGWNLTTAMADDAIEWMNNINQIDPTKPFFCYYVPGGTHAPHHATPEWIEKIHDMHLFDDGWNELRHTIYENQKRLGVIPEHAELTPWPDDLLKPWEQLTDDEKKMFIRQIEVYAAYLAYTDHEIGRVIDAVDAMGKLDNTIIIYISGDNGGSAEGTTIGTPNEVASFNGIDVPVERQLEEFYDEWGSNETYNHMAVSWSWAFDTPFSWTKQVASHFGGVKQGMCISWPGHIDDEGGVRHQFHHVIDIVPTLLEVTGIPAPESVDGIAQAPIEGVSMAYTFSRENADAPSTHKTQYFEMMGDHAIYHEGWIASTKVVRPPWNITGATISDPYGGMTWELYDLTTDWTQCHDLAAENPEKLKEMQALFEQQAELYQVFPLDASVATRLAQPRPNITAGRSEFVYTHPMVGLPQGDSPLLLNCSYTISAEITVPESGDCEGMLLTSGGRFGGYGLYVLEGKPVFTWNMVDLDRIRWAGTEALTPGKHTIEFAFAYDGMGDGTLAYNSMSGLGAGGTGTLSVDGTSVEEKKMEHTLPLILQWDESFDIGSDTATPVDDADYACPFTFTGTFEKLTVTVNRPQLSQDDIEKLEAAQRNNHSSE